MDGSPEGHPDGERLQKVLARVGLGSRRVCEDLIAEERVKVNGEIAELGRRVDLERDLVEVDGAPIGIRPGLVHYLLNKPAGVVTTASDPQGRPTVMDLVPTDPRVFPVGRLDMDTEGLLLLTNDGELANRIAHPSHGVEKEYLAEVRGTPSRAALRQLREGVELDDGHVTEALGGDGAEGAARGEFAAADALGGGEDAVGGARSGGITGCARERGWACSCAGERGAIPGRARRGRK